MINTKVQDAALLVYKKCNIKTYPIDCFDILKKLGYEAIKYHSLSEKKQNICFAISDEAYLLNKTIYYNDKQIPTRIRFSIMHEVGHIVLNHTHTGIETIDNKIEREADAFAAHILAPSMAIYYARCKSPKDVAKRFLISNECATYAYNRYLSWYQRTIFNKMTRNDKELYLHFYDDTAKKFVYSKHTCMYCDRQIYNSEDSACPFCKATMQAYINTSNYEVASSQNIWM